MKSWLGRMLSSFTAAGEDEDEDGIEDVEALLESAARAAREGDHQTAVAMWRPLAEGGVAAAQSSLGAAYVDGLGVARDPAEGARWFALAADAGDPVGLRNLAAMQFRGEGGLTQDDAAAIDSYRQAAEQGDAPSEDMLSWMLLEGRGATADPVEARQWALSAAEKGVASSMTRLGLIAQNGLGMEREPEEAARWWYEAARRGDPDGQAMLGAVLHIGSGVEKDDRAALVWLLRAERSGSTLAAPFFASVRAALAPEDIESAERAAAGQRLAGRSAAGDGG